MRLPQYLLDAIEQETSRIDRSALARASEELTERYKREKHSSPAINSAAHRAAYVATRLPATFAANQRVFAEMVRLCPNLQIRTILDLGSGPGTALFAAATIFVTLESATLIEADPAWEEIGARLSAGSDSPAVTNARRFRANLQDNSAFDQHELVVISYALGELNEQHAPGILAKAWQAASKALVVVEPGTRRGFDVVNRARTWLIAAGGSLVAPCPHEKVCPMAAAGDWCHFAQRVERTSQHRALKGGALGYEDEKFSYVAATRMGAPAVSARIVRHPLKYSGHVKLTLCTAQGLKTVTITRSQKERYRAARSAEWGDPWDL
jgi:ribosomal protein RSM22 (predicted rRNA methylase)